MAQADALAARLGLPSEADATVMLADAGATRRLGAALAGVLRAGDVLGLIGHLGAGKTTLMQGMLAALAPDVEVTSPTYTLMQHYASEPAVDHIDLYRLEHVDELETIGYWDRIEDGESVICVEWLDKVPEAWPGTGWICALHAEGSARRAAIWAPSPQLMQAVVERI